MLNKVASIHLKSYPTPVFRSICYAQKSLKEVTESQRWYINQTVCKQLTDYGERPEYNNMPIASPCSPPEHGWSSNPYQKRGLQYPLLYYHTPREFNKWKIESETRKQWRK